MFLHASEVVVFDGSDEVARHERLTTRYGSRLVLDHYLEALARKPGALPGATTLEQARASGAFTPRVKPGFLTELLMAECDERDRRRSERRIKAARLYPQQVALLIRLRRQPQRPTRHHPHPHHL